MSTITAIFEPDADGTVHVPVPAEWRHLPIKVTAEMEPAGDDGLHEPHKRLKGFGCLRGKIAMSPDFNDPLDDFAGYR